MSEQDSKTISWLAKLFRKKVKLTYWLDEKVYSVLICDFTEKEQNCILFKDYYTKNTTVVKYDKPINYVLEQIK
jgi:hypothetical protein